MTPTRRSAPPEITVHFAAPEQVAGETVYETDNLRIRLETPPLKTRGGPFTDYLKSPLIVENRRPVLAWIDARRSCVIDPEQGAKNLLFSDAILPGNNWTKLNHHAPSFITVNMNLWPAKVTRNLPATEGQQRILLHVTWDDGQSESADLTYQVTVTPAATRSSDRDQDAPG